MKLLTNFLDFLVDRWIMLNYVFYKFYSRFRKETNPEGRSLIYSPGWIWFNMGTVIFFLEDVLDIPLFSKIMNGHSKYWIIPPYIIMILLNYLFLYRGKKWKEIFSQLDMISDTVEFIRKKRNVTIYIWVSVALFLIPAIVKGLYYQFG